MLRFHPSAVAVLTIEGIIKHSSDQGSAYNIWSSALCEVMIARPKALVIRINSPGGTVGASQELFSVIKRIRENGTKVVAVMEDIAASGGLYIAMAAERIAAQPGTITGSIGVIVQNMEYSEILKKWQVNVNTIKSGEHKDIMSPTKPLSDQGRQILQDMVMDVYEQFCKAVAESRNMPMDQVKRIADGRIFSGMQAFELGLVDEHSSFLGAIDMVCNLAGIDRRRARFVTFQHKKGMFGSRRAGMMFSRIENTIPDADLKNIPLWLMPGR